jgi:hypothetical protein
MLTCPRRLPKTCMDLQSGREWKLVALPPHDVVHGTDGPWINLIGWLDAK